MSTVRSPEAGDPGVVLIDLAADLPFVRTRCGYACSDHSSFTKIGAPSAFAIEVRSQSATLNISRSLWARSRASKTRTTLSTVPATPSSNPASPSITWHNSDDSPSVSPLSSQVVPENLSLRSSRVLLVPFSANVQQ